MTELPINDLQNALVNEGLKSQTDAEMLAQANATECVHGTGESSTTGCNYITINELRGLDEGIADIFAFLDVKDPNFIGPSISQDIGRDMRDDRFYDDVVYATLAYSKEGDPHLLGAIVASIFYDLYNQIGLADDEIAAIVVKTLRDIRNPMPTFGVRDFFNALHVNLPTEHQASACALFQDRLPRVASELTCSL